MSGTAVVCAWPTKVPLDMAVASTESFRWLSALAPSAFAEFAKDGPMAHFIVECGSVAWAPFGWAECWVYDG